MTLAAVGSYTPGSPVGYALGVAGGLMMVALLTYPVLKRFPSLNLGPLRVWFRLHMVLGVLGPLLILAHSRLRVGSLNAGVALGCMLLVAGSGVVGRFIYRQIHHGLYGRRATLAELRAELRRQQAGHAVAPSIEAAVHAFERRAVSAGGAWRLLALPWLERAVLRDCERQLQGEPAARRGPTRALLAAQLRLVRAAAQFETYERLFSLWHVLHIPFVYMLAASAVVHVIAVHMY